MGRLIFVIFMLIISGIIYLVKAGAGKITGKEVDFKDESRKVMEKTAKGINWMNDQWERAKTGSATTKIGNDKQNQMSAIEFIGHIKASPGRYDKETADSLFVEQAVARMDKRQFDDAVKLIMQLDEGEGRSFMLNEIKKSRNA